MGCLHPVRPSLTAGWKLPVSLAGSLLVFIAYQEFAGTLPIYFWIPCMIGAAFLMCLLLHLLCDTTWLDAGFCCAQALVLAEFTAKTVGYSRL